MCLYNVRLRKLNSIANWLLNKQAEAVTKRKNQIADGVGVKFHKHNRAQGKPKI